MKRIAIVLGTRHEITNMSPMARACERQGDVDWSVSHTGRDCSCDVGRVFSGGFGYRMRRIIGMLRKTMEM